MFVFANTKEYAILNSVVEDSRHLKFGNSKYHPDFRNFKYHAQSSTFSRGTV